jgi:hypothetical protein
MKNLDRLMLALFESLNACQSNPEFIASQVNPDVQLLQETPKSEAGNNGLLGHEEPIRDSRSWGRCSKKQKKVFFFRD